MGFNAPDQTTFRIPVSDTRAYKQFGNSVVVPVFRAVAQMLLPILEQLPSTVKAKADDVAVTDSYDVSEDGIFGEEGLMLEA